MSFIHILFLMYTNILLLYGIYYICVDLRESEENEICHISLSSVVSLE